MEIFSGLSFVAALAAGLGVGTRLLVLWWRTGKLPELGYGVTALTFAIGGLLLVPILYLRDTWPESWLLTSSLAANGVLAVGASAVCLVTWRVFRPDPLWAALAWAIASLSLFTAIGVQVLRGEAIPHWALRPENHVYVWVRIAGFLWAGLEGLHHAGVLRRRLRLGLADPLAARQILLWGVSGVGIATMLTFWALAPHLGHDSVRDWPVGMFAANAIGIVSALALWLAFTPPRSWRRAAAEKRTACRL